MRILPGIDEPLSGPDEILYRDQKIVEASDNLYYDIVPFEMLRTVESLPQILVTVDGWPAVCHNLTCDFTYKIPEGEV
jgi:hypothetical protein